MSTKKIQEGSVFGGMLLIAGSCVGAGMLGLPILTGMAGLIPTLLMFFLAWLFMMSTALLLVEASGWFHTPVNFLTMIGRSLGKTGRWISWFLYLFLFYALIVAYLSGSGHHTSLFFKSVLSLQIPSWLGGVFFVILFGWIVYLGTKPVDLVNRFLMFGKIGAYFALVGLGLSYVTPSLLKHVDMKYTLFSLPILIISFGFHNMIPSLYSYLGGDVKRVKKSIVLGSLFTFFIYLLWEIITLGILPIQGEFGILDSFQKDIGGAQAIRSFLGANSVGVFAEILAFFAILTSFLAQALSLVHFLRDGFNLNTKKKEPFSMCLLALAPPTIFSMIYPELFFSALNFAGGVCAVILFGVFPALMVWIGRYREKIPSTYKIFGGQPLLIGVLLFSLFILFYQIASMCGFSVFPKPI
jgi:tyrosine-specific transport protein